MIRPTTQRTSHASHTHIIASPGLAIRSPVPVSLSRVAGALQRRQLHRPTSAPAHSSYDGRAPSANSRSLVLRPTRKFSRRVFDRPPARRLRLLADTLTRVDSKVAALAWLNDSQRLKDEEKRLAGVQKLKERRKRSSATASNAASPLVESSRRSPDRSQDEDDEEEKLRKRFKAGPFGGASLLNSMGKPASFSSPRVFSRGHAARGEDQLRYASRDSVLVLTL